MEEYKAILSIGLYGENRNIFYLYFDIGRYREYKAILSILSIGRYGRIESYFIHRTIWRK